MANALVFTSLVVAAWLVAVPAGAQSPRRIAGMVISAVDESPVSNVAITAIGETATARSATSGAFALNVTRLPARMTATRIGYAPDTAEITGDSQIVFRLRPAPLILSPSVVAGEQSCSAASSSVIRELDLQLRPRESSQELLRLAPGLVIAQHAGGGKAEQLYLRGFDADHGTDVAISVDGIPVNMVSHAHGQGYADLHWLIPGIVESAEVRKGPFDARDGDFATAGSVSFRTLDRLDGSSRVSSRIGAFGTRQAIALLPFGSVASRAGGYVAGSVNSSDGPFLSPQGYRRLNAFAKATAPLGRATELTAVASAFDATWNASGQVPDRAVRAGEISRFGAIDDSEGGTTSRYDASLSLRSGGQARSRWEATAYATKYDFHLFSNFTFFLADPVNGDGIEQLDDRTVFGSFGSWTGTLASKGVLTLGIGLRQDVGNLGLHSQRKRVRFATRTDVHLRQNHVYQWARYETAIGDRVRADLGIRADAFRFSVADRGAHASRARWESILSPKLNVAFDAQPGLTIFANAGTGFHSNDARDVIAAGPAARVLPRAVSSELGVRRTWAGGTVAVSAWWLDLQSETVFVGDEGTTESSGRTRRVGADIELRQRLLPFLWFDADINVARGHFRDEPENANRIPLAPARTATAGLTLRDLASIDGGVRVRHIASRAANEDNSVRALGHSLWEVFGAWQVGDTRIIATVDNLLNAEWNEAQFATTSRLRHEPAPMTELHYTPGSPRSYSVGIEWRF